MKAPVREKEFLGIGRAEFIPRLLFVVLFAWISFIPLPLQARYSAQFHFSLVAGLVFLWMKRGRSILRASDWPLCLFLVTLNAGVYVAANPKMAATTFLDLSIPMIFIYYLMGDNFSSLKNFDFLARVICFLSILIAFWGLMDVILRTDFLYEAIFFNPFYNRYKCEWPMRAIATQFHAPPLGTYLIASFPFSLLMIRQKSFADRALGLVGSMLAIVVAVLTFSRGVFLSLAVMSLCILFFQRRRKMIGLLLVGIAFFVFLAPYFHYPFEKFSFHSIFLTGDGVFTPYRFERLQMLGNILREHPFFGIGFQHVRLLFHHYYPGVGRLPYEFMIMDNMYWTIAAETGIVGITAFLVFICSMILKAWRGLKGSENDVIRKTGLFYVLIGFLGLLVNAAAYELFYWPSQYMFFCIYLGLIESFFRQRTEKS
jgi:O-antigen ligase